MDLTEKGVSSEKVFAGKLLHVFSDDVVLPNGTKTKREYIMHPGASCIVPVTADGKVIMVRQFRYPFHRVLLEIPAGKLDAGENPETAARRELKEETGVVPDELIYIGPYYPTCAYSDEVIHMYLARGLHFDQPHFDDDEFLSVEALDLNTLIKDVMNGCIEDGKTQTALLKAYFFMKQNKGE